MLGPIMVLSSEIVDGSSSAMLRRMLSLNTAAGVILAFRAVAVRHRCRSVTSSLVRSPGLFMVWRFSQALEQFKCFAGWLRGGLIRRAIAGECLQPGRGGSFHKLAFDHATCAPHDVKFLLGPCGRDVEQTSLFLACGLGTRKGDGHQPVFESD